MADVTGSSGQAPVVAPPVRIDEEIVPRNRWVQIGKSNCYLDLDKKQSNPIYKMAVDLLMHTNFHRAFTASSTIPSIYIQQFWDTIQYGKKVGSYRQAVSVSAYNWEENGHSDCDSKHPVHQTNYPSPLEEAQVPLRPDSSLHLPNEEPVLGYLKFSAKGSKREVFGMPIPGSLITSNIQTASYYQEYLASVAKHRKYLVGETGSHLDSPAPMPTKPARKPKSTSPKAPPRPSVSIPVTSAQLAPTSAPAKPKKGTLKHVPTSEAEDVSIMNPQVTAEDTELQKVLEESMKTAYAAAPQGPLPPVVIREPESGKYQPLPEVPGKGKAKVFEDQVAHDLLSLQKPKKKSPADQYILQRHISEPAGSSLHDDSPYAVLGQSESEEESEKVVLGATEGGQAGSNPDEMSEGQAGPHPGNAGDEEQSIPSPVVYAGSYREHMDLDVADVSPQHSTEQLEERSTATAYPKVQKSLKLAVKEQVLLEEPAFSSGTLSSLQHLSKDISFGDLFFSDRPSNADKNAKTEVESMSPKEHQQFKSTTTDTTTTTTTTLPPPQTLQQSNAEAMMIQRISKLEHIMANLIQVNKDMEERLDKHRARLYMLEQLDIPQQVSIAVSEVVTDAIDWAMQAPLQNRFRDLPEADMKEILHQRMWETESYKSHEDHTQLFKTLEKSMNRDHSEELAQDLAEARKKKKKSRESPKTPPGSPPYHPPPPPPPTGSSGVSRAPGSTAPSSSKIAASAEYQTWTMTDVRLMPSISLTPAYLEIDEDMGPDEQAQLSDDEDIGSAHIPKTGDMATFIDWFCKRRGITELKPQDLEGLAFEIIKVFHPDVIHLQYQMEKCHKLLTDSVDETILRNNVSKPLPLGGPSGQVTIQSDFVFKKDLEYLRYGSKGSRPALSISKMKAAYYPDAGLEQLEGRGSVQGVHVRYSEAFEDKADLLKPGELFDIEKVAVCSSLRSLKSKCTIESRAKGSSKRISLGHYPIMLASSHTVKSKTDIKSVTHYPCGIARTSE
nr:hypothetical protein [Tanacetum cinerariifolium]